MALGGEERQHGGHERAAAGRTLDLQPPPSAVSRSPIPTSPDRRDRHLRPRPLLLSLGKQASASTPRDARLGRHAAVSADAQLASVSADCTSLEDGRQRQGRIEVTVRALLAGSGAFSEPAASTRDRVVRCCCSRCREPSATSDRPADGRSLGACQREQLAPA